ncbi:MAG: hypothetical protein ACYC61_00395 [Isosphaeraceae bacterium]
MDHRSEDGRKHLETLFDSGTLGALGDDALLRRFATPAARARPSSARAKGRRLRTC